MAILLETEEYRVVRSDPSSPSKAAVVTWMALRSESSATADAPFPEVNDTDFVSRAGLVSLRVASKRNDWYQRPSHEAVVALLAQLRSEFDLVIAYGASMGGHAAIACAPMIGANCAIAFAPQVSLSDSYMKGIDDPRWSDARRCFVSDRILEGACRSVSGLVAFDPDSTLDNAHAASILDNTNMLPIRVRGAWHRPGGIVNASYGIGRLLNDVAQTLQRGEPLSRLAEAVSRATSGSVAWQLAAGDDDERRALLDARGWRLGPADMDFLAILETVRRTKSPVLLDLARRMSRSDRRRRRLARLLIDVGHFDEGLDLVLSGGDLKNFYHPGAHEAIRARASSLGEQALQAESRRLFDEGDAAGATFLRTLRLRLAARAGTPRKARA